MWKQLLCLIFGPVRVAGWYNHSEAVGYVEEKVIKRYL